MAFSRAGRSEAEGGPVRRRMARAATRASSRQPLAQHDPHEHGSAGGWRPGSDGLEQSQGGPPGTGVAVLEQVRERVDHRCRRPFGKLRGRLFGATPQAGIRIAQSERDDSGCLGRGQRRRFSQHGGTNIRRAIGQRSAQGGRLGVRARPPVAEALAARDRRRHLDAAAPDLRCAVRERPRQDLVLARAAVAHDGERRQDFTARSRIAERLLQRHHPVRIAEQRLGDPARHRSHAVQHLA